MAGAGAAAAPPPPQLLPGGREGAGDTMNRRRRAVGALLDELPTPGEYRAAVSSAEVYHPGAAATGAAEGAGAATKGREVTGADVGAGASPRPICLPPTLADASDALAVHTALHLAGRRAAVRKGGGERAGCVLLAGPK